MVSFSRSLSWFHHLKYRRTIDHLTVLHHLPDAARVANVGERIGIKNYQVGPLSHFYSAEILLGAKDARGVATTGVYCLQRRYPGSDQLLQLHVHTGWNLPDIGPGTNGHSRAP